MAHGRTVDFNIYLEELGAKYKGEEVMMRSEASKPDAPPPIIVIHTKKPRNAWIQHKKDYEKKKK